MAEALTQNVAALISAQQAAGGNQPLQAGQTYLNSLLHQHQEGLHAERKAHSWKTRRAVNWPRVRPGKLASGGISWRLALVADEFTSALLAYDADVTNLTPANCLERLETEHFDLFMVESVWFGSEKSWDTLWKDAKVGNGLFLRLVEAIACCRRRGIPTVFWNKEDPEHYELFLPIARLFDQVYTTEAACVDNYRADLGHDRVGTIGFAAQAQLQTPFLQTGQQRAGVAFAGSWYRGKHAYRARQQADLLTAGLDFGLDIYDRALRDKTGQFTYPPEFRANIVGTLDFYRVCTAYRQYDVFLNVNTVSESETMCARRVFEIAASRTAIVTTPSRAVDRIFGDAIPNGEGVAFFREAIGTYMREPSRRIRDAHLIYRETHGPMRTLDMAEFGDCLHRTLTATARLR